MSAPWVVLGGSGFIGRWVVKALRSAGVTVFDPPHYELDTLRDIPCIGGVVNCSGLNRADPSELFEANVSFTLRLVALLNEVSCPRLIHISSERVYGFDGDASVSDLSPFGKSKLLAENFLLSAYPRGRVVILRPSNVVGPWCLPHYNSVVATWISEALRDRRLITSNAVRDFVAVKDLADVVLRLVQLPDSRIIRNVLDVRGCTSPGSRHLIETAAGMIASEIGSSGGWESNNIFDSTPAWTASWTPPSYDAFEFLDLPRTSLRDMLVDTIAVERRISQMRSGFEPPRLFPVSSPKGAMLEFPLQGVQRLYDLALIPGVVRGGHYHKQQTELFRALHGPMALDIEAADVPDATLTYRQLSSCTPFEGSVLPTSDRLYRIPPGFIHRVWNPSVSGTSIAQVASTQPFVDGQTPDTFYR